jgi:hypothetical protein
MHRSGYRQLPTDTPTASDDGFTVTALLHHFPGHNPAVDGMGIARTTLE